MKLRGYISGPMRGRPDLNFPAFYDAEAILEAYGFDSFNPARADEAAGIHPTGDSANEFEATVNGSAARREVLTRDMAEVAKSDFVVVLPGWEESAGAKAEVAMARGIGMPVVGVAHLDYRLELWELELLDLDAREPEPKVNVSELLAVEPDAKIRSFETGANRDTDSGKLDFEGFLAPQVLWAFAEYMNGHRRLPNGELRDSDNWQKGIPLDVYMKSLLRHVFDLWLLHRGHEVVRPEDGSEVTIEDALGGILFNAQGYWLETIKSEEVAKIVEEKLESPWTRDKIERQITGGKK